MKLSVNGDTIVLDIEKALKSFYIYIHTCVAFLLLLFLLFHKSLGCVQGVSFSCIAVK